MNDRSHLDEAAGARAHARSKALPGDGVRFDAATAALILIALVLFLAHASPLRHVDTNAFYCGARVLGAGDDPYRFGALHSCEAANLNLSANQAVPNPLPPYAMAMWRPLTFLSFGQANVVWLLLILASACVITYSVVRLTGFPFWLVGGCVLADTLVEPLANGAMAPIPIALLCAAAVALMRGRMILSSFLLGLAAIQPHVAVPVILTAFLLVPKMRVWLAIVVGLFLTATFATGSALNIEYVTRVLPLHAVSEFGSSNQYGLSTILHLLGLPDKLALAVGSFQYAAFVVVGIVLARALQYTIPGCIVLAPLTCAVTGGTFIHQTEIAGALPFAFVVAASVPTTVAWLAVTILAIPLEYVLDYGFTLVAGLVVCLVLLYRTRLGSIGAVVTGLLLSVGFMLAHNMVRIRVLHIVPPRMSANTFADIAWKVMQGGFPPLNAFWWPTHVLTYVGLALVLWTAFEAPRREDARTPSLVMVPSRQPFSV